MARIISQSRGTGSPTYDKNNVRKKYTLKYNRVIYDKNYFVKDIIYNCSRTSPIIKLQIDGKNYYNIAVEKMVKNTVVSEKMVGYVTQLKNLLPGTKVCNVEIKPFDGGKLFRAAGVYAEIVEQSETTTTIKSQKRRFILSNKCYATIGVPGASNRNSKPYLKAGTKYYKFKFRRIKYPFVSRVAMNHHDHCFGSSGPKKPGRPRHSGRNYPPGAKVGSIAPKRQGYRK